MAVVCLSSSFLQCNRCNRTDNFYAAPDSCRKMTIFNNAQNNELAAVPAIMLR